MEITVSLKDLSAALPSLVAVADKRNTSQPSLEHVRFEASKGKVAIVAGDLNVWTFAEVPAAVTRLGRGTASAKMFGDLVSKLDGEILRLTVLDNYRLRVQIGKSKHEIPGLDPADYPAVPEVSGKWASVPGMALATGIGGVIHAVSTDDTRAHLRGVHVRHRGKQLEFTTTDGHRCARNFADADLPGFEALIPTKAAQEIARLADGADEVEVAIGKWKSSQWVFVRRGGVTIAAQLMADAFPGVLDNLFALERPVSAEVGRAELLSALRRVGITGNQENKKDPMTEMRIGQDLVTLVAGVDCMEEMDAKTAGDYTCIGISARYASESVSSLDGNAISISVGTGESDPILIRPVDGNDMRLVLPMRL